MVFFSILLIVVSVFPLIYLIVVSGLNNTVCLTKVKPKGYYIA